ncbi:MAG: stage II sporulation protein P, partial [Clostridia bacterium]|nr:stage II sporulation protein P [Clostridia bacterium]
GSVFGGRKNIVVLTSSNGSEGSERHSFEITPPVSEAQSSTDEETDVPETVPESPGAESMSVSEDEAEETEAEEQDGQAESDPFPFLPLRLTNETGYEPDLAACAEARAIPPLGDLPEETGGDEPFVLILHTHGTEAYRECAGGNYRSRDPSLSVLCLGEQLADRLNGAGISALRLSDLFDAPDFNLAYSNAASAIRDTLALYPSIRYIFDLHRDSVVLGDGTVCRTSASLEDGTRAAQMMFVVGTDEAGAIHPGWRDNLGLAVRLQTALNREHPNLMRDINLRSASFNEQYTPGSLLIEIGSSGCSLEEAKKAADLLADALIAEIRGEE